MTVTAINKPSYPFVPLWVSIMENGNRHARRALAYAIDGNITAADNCMIKARRNWKLSAELHIPMRREPAIVMTGV